MNSKAKYEALTARVQAAHGWDFTDVCVDGENCGVCRHPLLIPHMTTKSPSAGENDMKKNTATVVALIAPGLTLMGIFWLGGWAFERGPAAAALGALSVMFGLAAVNAVVAYQDWEKTI